MEAENNVNRLFEQARNAPPETSISEVEAWIHAVPTPPNYKAKKYIKLLRRFNPNTFIIMSILIALLTSALLVFTPGTPSKPRVQPVPSLAAPVSLEKPGPVNPSATMRTSKAILAPSSESNQPKPTFGLSVWNTEQPLSAPAWAMASGGSAPPESEPFGFTLPQAEAHPSETNPSAPTFSQDAPKRTWISQNDLLAVDTLFSRVKKLVYTSRAGLDLRVIGSSRSDISLSCFFQRKTKGTFIRMPRKHELRLSYFIKDSVLYVNLEENHLVTVGIAIQQLNPSNRIVFSVPQSLEIEAKTSYSDVEMEHLNSSLCTVNSSNGDIKLRDVMGKLNINSSYGDVVLEKMNGNMRLKSKYGDVKLQDLARNHYSIESTHGDIQVKSSEGELEVTSTYGDLSLGNIRGNLTIKTMHGDVRGTNLKVQDQMNIATTYGDVDCQVADPTSELQFDLSTGFGDVQVRRNDLRTEESKSLQSGNGKRKLNVKTNYGDITIR